jgi:hypothetical protein
MGREIKARYLFLDGARAWKVLRGKEKGRGLNIIKIY